MLTIERFVCNMFQENCYVVSDDSGECVIIDCGALYPEEQQAIEQYISRRQLRAVSLVATHGHIDHNYGNAYIHKTYGLQPCVHGGDEPLMSRLDEQAVMFTGMPLTDGQPPVGRWLDEGDTIDFGSHRLEVISTPGHSPGSVVLLCRDGSDGQSDTRLVAFTGDTIFRMSIGRTDLMLGSFDDIKKSLSRLTRLLPPQTVLLTGHGPQTTMADEIRMNPYVV